MKSIILITFAVCMLFCVYSEAIDKNSEKFLDKVYPEIANRCLKYSVVADLPEGTILRCGSFEIKEKDLRNQIKKYPEELRSQLEKNLLFFLEQLATETILVQAAKKDLKGKETTNKNNRDILELYFKKHLDSIDVSETEIKKFYQENKAMMGGLSLQQVKKDLENFLLQEKRKSAIEKIITEVGQSLLIEIDKKWLEKQIPVIRDNPVDRARYSGKPTLVDFGADGCLPCDMMAPILKKIEKKYEGKLNVVFIHVRKEQVLSARYGIQSIPVQIFFDKNGKEVFRHTGFYSEDEIENKIKSLLQGE